VSGSALEVSGEMTTKLIQVKVPSLIQQMGRTSKADLEENPLAAPPQYFEGLFAEHQPHGPLTINSEG
jgi:hypothetical protein